MENNDYTDCMRLRERQDSLIDMDQINDRDHQDPINILLNNNNN